MTKPTPIVILWGDDHYLLREAALEHLAARGVHATEVDVTEWQGGETSDLATPSLWGEERALLVTNAQSLKEEGLRELKGYLASPADTAVLVLTALTRGKNPPPLVKAAEASMTTVKQVALKRQDLPRWVLERARARGVQLSPPGAAALVGTIGEDPASLDQAVEQLASAFAGVAVGPDEVHRQFRGHGEQRVWDLCDQALSGRKQEAMVILRSLFDAKDDPLLVLGGIASRVRDLLRVRALSDRLSSADAAKAAGLRFDWQLRRYRDQARRFSEEELLDLHGMVVEADRALKGGMGGDVVLPVLVARMAGDRDARLDVPVRVAR